MTPVQPQEIAYGDLTLAGRLYRPQDEPRGAAVIAHGLYSSMQSEKLNRLAAALAEAGYLALMFDATGCGDSPGDVRQTTLTSRHDELLAAVEHLARLAPGLPMAYLGSSLGGTAALLAADTRPPACTVVWSAPSDLQELFMRLRSRPDPPELPAMARDLGRHDLEGLLGRLSRVLWVHGEQDEVVPVSQARRGYQLLREPKGLVILPGADHRFTRPEDQKTAVEHTLAWLGRFLTPESH